MPSFFRDALLRRGRDGRDMGHAEKTARKTAGWGAREGERKRGREGEKERGAAAALCSAADGFLLTFAAGVGR